MKRLTLLSLLALSAAASAQTATFTLSGPACTTGRITPALGAVPFSALNTPRIGTTFQVATESTANYPFGNNRQVYLLTGFSNSSLGGLPLPFDLASLNSSDPICGLLSTSAEVSTPVPLQASFMTPSIVSINIPNSTNLLGLAFYQQVASIETSTFGPPFFSLALSQLGTGVVGT